MTGSGKSTFAFLHLLNTNAACRFIFDDLGQASARLKIPLCSTREELERAKRTRWVLFNPHKMFEGELEKGFDWFCDYVFESSRLGRGKKMVFVDEIWRMQNRQKISKSLARLSQMGRSEGIELVTATQEPHRLNSSILGSSTELVCFRLQESVELLKIRGLGADPVAVSQLPPLHFISYDRIGRKSCRGVVPVGRV